MGVIIICGNSAKMADSEATSVETVDLAYSEEQERQSHSSSGPSSTNTTPTLLSVLHAPQPSNLMRPRQVKHNPPVGKKRHVQTLSDPKSVSLKQRLKKFPDETLTVSVGKLFSTACREELELKAGLYRVVSNATVQSQIM